MLCFDLFDDEFPFLYLGSFIAGIDTGRIVLVVEFFYLFLVFQLSFMYFNVLVEFPNLFAACFFFIIVILLLEPIET